MAVALPPAVIVGIKPEINGGAYEDSETGKGSSCDTGDTAISTNILNHCCRLHRVPLVSSSTISTMFRPLIYMPRSCAYSTANWRRTFATISERTLHATPLGPVDGTFGAEVSGVDFSRPLAPPIVAEIVQLQNLYGVLLFRSTGLDDDAHVRYSKNFGALESIHGVNKPRRASSPHLYDAGNLDAEGNIIPKYSRAWWHSKGNGRRSCSAPLVHALMISGLTMRARVL